MVVRTDGIRTISNPNPADPVPVSTPVRLLSDLVKSQKKLIGSLEKQVAELVAANAELRKCPTCGHAAMKCLVESGQWFCAFCDMQNQRNDLRSDKAELEAMIMNARVAANDGLEQLLDMADKLIRDRGS